MMAGFQAEENLTGRAPKKMCEKFWTLSGRRRRNLLIYDFPPTHWRSIRTNNLLERINREIRRRTGVVGNFSDGQSALMLACAGLRYIAGHKWGERYLNTQPLHQPAF